MSNRICAPGDVVVAHVYGGWVLGRITEEVGPGPWWEFVAVSPELTEAIERARQIACAMGMRVYLHDGGEEYRHVPCPEKPSMLRAS
jgi:hypothetical protein